MNLTVLQPGVQTSVQDLGRWGHQSYGVSVGGAMDALAARLVNLLAGNPENVALLELAQVGPDLQFEADTLAAWSGGDFPARVRGEYVPPDRPFRIGAGEVLSFGLARDGLRAWLAVAGGLDVPLVLGSRSTWRRAGIGGHQGRPLVRGDLLRLGPITGWAAGLLRRLQAGGQRSTSWSIRPATLGKPGPPGVVRALRGPEWDWFTPRAQRLFLSSEWRVTEEADRMGARLAGPELEMKEAREMISSGVTAGVIQVPAGGHPLVLLAARQSVGGYPRLAVVASADLGKLAQLRPGDAVRFEEITLSAAHDLSLARERDLARARSALRQC